MTSRAFSDHFPSNSGDGRQQSAAFQGASHAFSLAGQASHLPKAYTGTNGALAAATSAGMGIRWQGVHLAEGATSNGPGKKRPSTKSAVWSGVSKRDGTSQEQSPSYAAALHATSKPTPTSIQWTFGSTSDSRHPSRLQNVIKTQVSAPTNIMRSTDETVIGTTSSLVSLFESKQNDKSVPTVHSVRYVTKPASTIASQTPSMPTTKPRLPTTDSLSTFPLAIELGKEFSSLDASSTAERSAAATAAQLPSHTVAYTRKLSHSPHSTLLPRTMPEPPARPRSVARMPSNSSLTKARNVPRNLTGSHSSSLPQAWVVAPHSDPAFLSSKPSSTSHSRPHLPVRPSRSFEMKVDSLANTIVAASLASSRAPTPTRTPPPPPPPRRHKSHPLFNNHNSQGHTSRTPSPAKIMRQTMRETLPSDNDVENKKKGILMRKHPHKHHEGNRKRYRAVVTERERRRYDGLWAANKGLWMDANSSSSVLNLVVRDIWSRSRLPTDVLAEIWDLVNIHGRDRLQRSEFIVGMWLIDQRLKGRKLPFVVSETVWNSVRFLHGIDVS